MVNIATFLIVVTVTSGAAQTFHYSAGWINGKRGVYRKPDEIKDIAINLEKILSPCQMNKLKYVLEGKPLHQRVIKMAANITTFLIVVTLTSVAAQTFQYSRGWTNGKRDGHRKTDEIKDIANNLEKILTPCQMNELKYVLEGKPLNERIFLPCDYIEEDADNQPKRYKGDRGQDPLFEAFQ